MTAIILWLGLEISSHVTFLQGDLQVAIIIHKDLEQQMTDVPIIRFAVYVKDQFISSIFDNRNNSIWSRIN